MRQLGETQHLVAERRVHADRRDIVPVEAREHGDADHQRPTTAILRRLAK